MMAAVTDRETIKDRVTAALTGYAIGDALGKGTEFMSKEEVSRHYPSGLRDYPQIIRDAHRSQWKKNEWTLDTDNVIRLLRVMLEDGRLDLRSQARSIKEWYDSFPTDMIQIVKRVSSEAGYCEAPLETSRRVWDSLKHPEASNEGLGAALFAALDPEGGWKTGVEVCALTHYDSRCRASAAIVGCIAHRLLWHSSLPERDELTGICRETDERALPYMEMAYDGNLGALDLDDNDTLWYARKAMGCGVWAMTGSHDGEKILYDIVAEGGDADTNASLALALAGLRDGMSAIPPHLAEGIAHREELASLGEAYADYLLAKLRNCNG